MELATNYVQQFRSAIFCEFNTRQAGKKVVGIQSVSLATFRETLYAISFVPWTPCLVLLFFIWLHRSLEDRHATFCCTKLVYGYCLVWCCYLNQWTTNVVSSCLTIPPPLCSCTASPSCLMLWQKSKSNIYYFPMLDDQQFQQPILIACNIFSNIFP